MSSILRLLADDPSTSSSQREAFLGKIDQLRRKTLAACEARAHRPRPLRSFSLPALRREEDSLKFLMQELCRMDYVSSGDPADDAAFLRRELLCGEWDELWFETVRSKAHPEILERLRLRLKLCRTEIARRTFARRNTSRSVH